MMDEAERVLVMHQRRGIEGCLCGWSDLGKSHPAHQVQMLIAAGVLDPAGARNVMVLDRGAQIGAALYKIRKSMGLTRDAVARSVAAATGRYWTSTRNQLYDWEANDKVPDLASLEPFMKALGCRLRIVIDRPQVDAKDVARVREGLLGSGRPQR